MGFLLGVFAAVYAAFAFGTLWWWLVLIIALAVITALVENEQGGKALFGLLVAFTLLTQFHIGAIFSYITHHPGTIALYLLGYVIVGTLYGILKWYLYVTDQLAEYKEKKAKFLRRVGATELTPALAVKFKEDHYRWNDPTPPQVANHKGDILLWMSYWPFSGLWTLLNDPLRRIFKAIYTHLSGGLQRLSNRMFKGAIADIELAKAYVKPDDGKR